MSDTAPIRLLHGVEAGRRWLRRSRGRSLAPQVSPEIAAELEQRFGPGTTPASAVEQILEEVAEDGDQALRRWTVELDREDPDALILGPDLMASAFGRLEPDLQEALTLAADRIRRFHEAEPVDSWTAASLGGRVGQRISPIRRAGVYVPGGSAPLPSSLLMAAIPAQVAGVTELVAATPPPAAPMILAAGHLCGVDELVQAGGAQAIGALAYGTESIRPVDKIVGPGGLFVTLAKRAVYGVVGLDGLAGPTETLIIAEEPADPAWLAADLLAQAEHDPLASALLITTSDSLAARVRGEIRRQIDRLPRRAIARQSLQDQGAVIVVDGLTVAVELANEYAPEHLCLSLAEPERLLNSITSAGGIFAGERSCEVLGDYAAGPSHIMPTGGTARFAGPLSVRDFMKATSLIALDNRTSKALAPAAARLARAEGLEAHAAAADLRTGDDDV